MSTFLKHFLLKILQIVLKYYKGGIMELKIKEYRKLNNLTQTDIAQLTGYQQTLISKWENKEREPNLDVICKLADTFNISVDELVGRNYKKVATQNLTENQQKILDILPSLNEQQCSAVLSMIKAFNTTTKEQVEMARQIRKFEDK